MKSDELILKQEELGGKVEELILKVENAGGKLTHDAGIYGERKAGYLV